MPSVVQKRQRTPFILSFMKDFIRFLGALVFANTDDFFSFYRFFISSEEAQFMDFKIIMEKLILSQNLKVSLN